jgi:hypothetical protein
MFMVTRFSLTYDSRAGANGLTLVAGEHVLDDVAEVRIWQPKPGAAFQCELVRRSNGNNEPARLVASSMPEAKRAVERAVAREDPATPGFVKMTPAAELRSVEADICKYFGCE